MPENHDLREYATEVRPLEVYNAACCVSDCNHNQPRINLLNDTRNVVTSKKGVMLRDSKNGLFKNFFEKKLLQYNE
jgi:hypothetical protein